MRCREFPEQVKRGSSVVTIYFTSSKGYEAYTVVHHDLTGTRRRRMFADYNQAKQTAINTAESLAKGKTDLLVLTGSELIVYKRALEAMEATRVPLDMAAIQFASATKLLGDTPLIVAVSGYVERKHAQRVTHKSVPEVVTEMLKVKEASGRSDLYLKDLRLRLNRVKAAFSDLALDELTPNKIEQFLHALPGAPRTKNNFRLIIGTLIRFGQNKGYVSRDHPGITFVEKMSQTASEVQVFTPDEIRTLLHAAQPKLKATLAIGAFAGLRSEELKRLDWCEVKLKQGHIELTSAKSKTRIRRLVPISKNLKAWLMPLVQESGRVTQYYNLANEILKLASKSNVGWKRNGLRHSFISYRVALTEDVAAVSLEAGNSPQIISRNYLKCVRKSEARRWFGVFP